ncbi:helix-turn-helix domain-containing protein [Candidatus Tachikawaea gelatinosa]|uniref:Cytoskeleton protein RodZ n=1 Tax=Candidatus Tachikawaea gelatinosa TaxID=1410383 RepID=A0A090ALD7_9ENTR|nr:helix-turn-helix domain-containing protein [Candidatus Tachikawaea gelatinosa]BAP58444.1 cytoskeleton protein RodZ [Candidatus Tachikawaea gelatinosa]
MNINSNQNEISVDSIGNRLKTARKKIGLTQQDVADKLYLKVSIIKDLEENELPKDISLTFLKGYIRSYARLVEIPEDELLLKITEETPIKLSTLKSKKIDSISHRDYSIIDNWLKIFTWFVIFIISVLVGIWWIKTTNHLSKKEVISVVDQSSLNENKDIAV